MLKPTKSLLGLLSAIACFAVFGPQAQAFEACESELVADDPAERDDEQRRRAEDRLGDDEDRQVAQGMDEIRQQLGKETTGDEPPSR